MWMVKRIIKPLSLGEIANEKRAWERASWNHLSAYFTFI